MNAVHRAAPTTRHRRRGVSLMEVLLVMALLVAVAAMALPTLKGPMENHRLRKSADVVRVQWARAHVKAMESGRTYVFRYQLGGNQFLIEPWYLDDDAVESSEPFGAGAAAGSLRPASTTVNSTNDSGTLPDDISFVLSETAADSRAMYLTATSTSGQLADAQWSDPIFFYPDGTASTARLVLTNTRQRFVVLRMRGMTGVVQVSDLLVAEEVQ